MGKNKLKQWVAAMIVAVLAAGCLPESLQDKIEVKREVKAAATLSNPRIVADSSMTAGQKVTWDCVWFGSYPQTEIVDKAETCGTYGNNWRTASDYEVDAALYDYLEKATGWDNKGDITYNGTKYRRIRQNDATYSISGNPGIYDWTGSDTYHYFRYDPIKWRVLNVSGGKAFLLADKALDDRKYNTSFKDVSWKTGTIRSWLNGTGSGTGKSFIGSAFSSAEQGAILNTSVVNNNNIIHDTAGGNDTTDKIFLLSEAEVYDTEAAKGYGFVSARETNDEARRCQSTTYAKAMGTWTTTEDPYRGNCIWWLRSPGYCTNYAAIVINKGFVFEYGIYVHNYINGVRPALNLNLSSSDLRSYAGTVCSDGTVKESYSVTFVDGQGKTLKKENVEKGQSANAPTAPKRTGYTFTGWDKDFSKVTSNMTVTAKWKKNQNPAPAPSKTDSPLLAKMTAKGRKSLVLTWSRVKDADGYDIFFIKCDKGTPRKIKTIKAGRTLKWTKTGLIKGKVYKAYVKAFVMKKGKKSYVKKSPSVHAYTSGGTKNYTNPKSVTVKKPSVSLRAGKTYKIKANVIKLQKGKELMPEGHAPKLRYISSNKKIARVSKTGKITAKAKGSCKVYVIAVNGVRKAVKITVN